MQIGQLNHLNLPKSSNPLLAANTGDDSTAAAGGTATSGAGAALPVPTPAQDAPGVVLKLQSEATIAGAGQAKGLVYSNGRNPAAGSDDDSDTERMALQHSQAVLRNAGSTTRLTVDKDGVLVAGAASAADSKPKDFVTLAVSAMRDYADEQERLKTAAQASEGTTAASLIPRSLAEVQKLAARFKLFA
jgi:hypothetical protein